MKLVIDIPEEKYEWIKKNNPNVDINSIVGAIANGTPYEERPYGEWIPIPENATNGDVLLTMFDAALIYGIDKENDCVTICIDNNFYQKFRYRWWYAPYERGEEE